MPSFAALSSVDDLAKLVDKLIAEDRPFAFDIETGYEGADSEGASLHPEQGFVVGFSFTNDTRWARYVPLAHDVGANLDPYECAPHLWRLLQTGLGVAHNIKFEERHLATFFRKYLDPALLTEDGYFPFRSDTMIEAYMLSRWPSVGLKSLTKEIYNYDQAELKSLYPGKLTKKQEKCMRFNVLELTPVVIGYACDDSVTCLMLHLEHFDQVMNSELKFLFGVELKILPILCRMEDYGLRYDWEGMRARAADVKSFSEEMRREIMADLSARLGRSVDINLGSPKQLSDMLFGELGMKTTRMTKGSKNTDTPKMSTDAVALEGLAKKDPLVKKIVQWREVNKLLGSYLDKYERDFLYADDARAHPNHMQASVGSGRFAVADPPYQQTPKKYNYELSSGRTLKFNFRNFIMADPDHYLLAYDYSQVELRVMAGASQEPALLKAFEAGEDVHARTAALMFHIPIEQVTPEQRDKGKTLNFALLYGQGVPGTAEQLGISREEAQELYDAYFAAYSSIDLWIQRVTRETCARGYSISWFKRKFTIWELKSTERWIYSKGERLCVNAPIQGGAADYMKIAMVRADSELRKADLHRDVHMIMNIHDALIFEIPKHINPRDVIKVLQPAVTFPVKGWPKIVADWSLGKRWGSMEALIVSADGSEVRRKPAEDAPPEPESDPQVAPQAVEIPAPVQPELTASEPDAKWLEERAEIAKREIAAEDGIVTAESLAAEMEAREIHVRLTEMPDNEQYARFLGEMKKRPGNNTIVLMTPEGDAPLQTRTSLTPSDAALVSMCLGGAEVRWAPSSVDADVVTAGLSL